MVILIGTHSTVHIWHAKKNKCVKIGTKSMHFEIKFLSALNLGQT